MTHDYNNGQIHGWNGGECPVHPETMVEVWFRGGGSSVTVATRLFWTHSDKDGDIIAFKVVGRREMTDEELLLWLRVEDTNLTDFAADRIEALVNEAVLSKAAYEGVSSLLLSVQQDCIKERQRAERLEEALLWCSGSADFNEGGVAREGWLKVCAPLLRGDTP